jgi:ankyrin repeat protein
VQYLLAHGARVTDTSAAGITALLVASGYGHESTVRFLLAQGANVNETDLRGCTSFFVAAMKGHLAIVQVLAEGVGGVSASEANRVQHH